MNKSNSISPRYKGDDHDMRKRKAQQTTSCAVKYAYAILDEIGIDPSLYDEHIRIGPIKGDEEVDRKAASQYGGDRNQVDDNFRMQIFTTSIDEMKKMLKLFCSPNMRNLSFHKDMQSKRNIRLRKEPKNHTEYPKRWGWQGIIVKAEGRLSNGNKIPFEIQIIDDGMKEIYEWSHKEYEKVRTALEEWENSDKEIHDVLQQDELEIVKDILERHKTYSTDLGLHRFWKSDYPEVNSPTPLIKEENVDSIDKETLTLRHDVNPILDPC